LGGWLTAVIGRYRAIIGFGALQGLGVAAYAWLSWHHEVGEGVSMAAIYGINALEHFASGMAMAALLTAVMDLSRPNHAGADFTVQVSILAIFGGSFHLGAGFVAEALGYTRLLPDFRHHRAGAAVARRRVLPPSAMAGRRACFRGQ
jgi:PAT family beta-lactamase induction signal transducer AmpG